jgi:hypothetical protein
LEGVATVLPSDVDPVNQPAAKSGRLNQLIAHGGFRRPKIADKEKRR